MKQIEINAQIDDLPLSPEAFRVYFFLSKYYQLNNHFVGDDSLIGVACFPNDVFSVAMRKAGKALHELIEWNLVYADYQDFTMQSWRITDSSEWKRPGGAV